MLVINVKRNNNLIEEVIFHGHAEFNKYGKDIVCAAASSIVITSINAILSFDENAISYTKEDNLVIKNLKKDEITNKLLNNMYELLKDLEKQYKKNIKIG